MLMLLQEEALQAFIQPETLDGPNQYFCERCKKKCDARKVSKVKTWSGDGKEYSVLQLNSSDAFFFFCFLPRVWGFSTSPTCWRCSWKGLILTTPLCIASSLTTAWLSPRSSIWARSSMWKTRWEQPSLSTIQIRLMAPQQSWTLWWWTQNVITSLMHVMRNMM